MDHPQLPLGTDAGGAAAADDPLHDDVPEVRDEGLGDGGLVVLAAGRAVGVIALEDNGFVLDVRHVDVADPDAGGLAAALRGALETQARVGAAEGVVPHDDVLHPAAEFGADDKAAMGVVDGIVLDKDVLARAVFQGFLTDAALEADAVVAHVHGAAGDLDAPALHDVDSVAVLCIPGAPDRHPVNDDVRAALGHQVELRGVLQGHARDADPLAVRKADQVRPQGFLGLGILRDVVVMLEPERVPQGTIFADGAAFLAEFLPLRVADLVALDGPPPGAVAVDDPFAGDAHVMPLGSVDAGPDGVAVEEVFLVGGQEDDCAAFQVQVDAVLQADGPGQEDALRDVEMAAALLDQGIDGLGESLGIEGDSVRDAAVVQQGYGVIGDDGFFRCGHGRLGGQEGGKKGAEDGKEGTFHVHAFSNRTQAQPSRSRSDTYRRPLASASCRMAGMSSA